MRTADDAMLTVKLMIFYELTDIIKLVSFCYFCGLGSHVDFWLIIETRITRFTYTEILR